MSKEKKEKIKAAARDEIPAGDANYPGIRGGARDARLWRRGIFHRYRNGVMEQRRQIERIRHSLM